MIKPNNKSHVLLAWLLLYLTTTGCNNNNETTQNVIKETTNHTIAPPKCTKKPEKLEKHGDIRIDNYYWLNQRENPEVIAYLESENAYTAETFEKPTRQLQQDLFKELKSRIKEDDSSVPYFHNNYYYSTRYEKGKEYAIHIRKKESLSAQEEILLDENQLAQPHAFFELGGYEISPDNTILAYSIDTISRRIYSIHFKTLIGNKQYSEVIPNTTGTFVWANDNKTIFYVVQDQETLRSYKIMKHTLGTPVEEDQTIYIEEDEIYSVDLIKTKTNRYIIIGSYSTLAQEFRLINADTPEQTPKLFAPRKKGLEYGIYHHEDKFYIITNKDNAKNFKIMVCNENQTLPQHWKDFIPYDSTILTEDIEVFKNQLVISERKNGLTQIRIHNFTTNQSQYLAFNDPAYLASVGYNPEYNTNKMRYFYTSMTTPYTQYEINMDTQEKTILKRQEIIGGHNPEDYTSERIYVTSRDGKKIPMSIVRKKTTQPGKNTPLLIYGYGSYGVNIDPTFSRNLLSLLNRGFIYAIAHVRGSQTLGREWYEDGKFLKKKNTFYDFIDCSKYLIDNNYTSPDYLFAEGGSAGGLLMGAIINFAPELYQGVIAEVPFVDVLTTMLDPSIPLTTGEYEEWGNPEDKTYYDYIKSYSPYDNVEAKNYPNLLVTTGLHDSQVQYWEPAKWVAKLRELKTDNNLLLLKTNMEVGHGGASGRFEYLKEVALNYAFLLHLKEKTDHKKR